MERPLRAFEGGDLMLPEPSYLTLRGLQLNHPAIVFIHLVLISSSHCYRLSGFCNISKENIGVCFFFFNSTGVFLSQFDRHFAVTFPYVLYFYIRKNEDQIAIVSLETDHTAQPPPRIHHGYLSPPRSNYWFLTSTSGRFWPIWARLWVFAAGGGRRGYMRRWSCGKIKAGRPILIGR